jgi:hypothetical protein
MFNVLIMKTLTGLFILFAVLGGLSTANAQSSKKERNAAKAAAVTKMINDINYVFEANTANPQRGGQKQLTSEYDLKVTKDTVIAFLPYFGRAYLAPDPGTTEGGIKFTTTNFSYSSKQSKNGNWNILIKPKDKNMTNWRDVEQLILNISADGYALLQVISTHRDPISFNGYIQEVKN